MARVTAPNPEFSGSRFGVRFFNGRASTDDAIAIGRLLRAGYLVDDRGDRPVQTQDEPEPELTPEPEPEPEADQLDLESLTVRELVTLAGDRNIDLQGARRKSELIAAVRAAEGA